MSNVIDTRIVEMQFENGKFERDVNKTIDLLQELDSNLEFKNAAEGFKNLTAAANNVSLQGIADSIEFIEGKFTGLGHWIMKKKDEILDSIEGALKRVGNMFTMEPIMSGWEEYNVKTKATQTLLNNVSKYGSTMEDVSVVLDKLNTYADKTTYSFAGMIQTLSGASTAGLNLDELYDYTVGLSNLAAYSGVDNTQMQRAGYQINQALNKGYFEAIDWKSLTNANLDTNQFRDTIKQVAMENGLNVDELIASSKEGTFQNSMSEFKWLTKEIFLEALGRYTDTTTELGQAAFESATKTKTFGEALDQVKESLGSGWTKTFELLIGNVEQAKEFWTPLTNSILEFTDSMSDSRNQMLDLFRRMQGPKIILDTMLTLLDDLKWAINAVTDEWGKHFKAIKAKDLKKFFIQVKTFVDKTLSPTPKKLYIIQSAVGFVAESIKVVGTLLEGVWKILEPIGEILWSLADALIYAGAQFLDFASNGMEANDWATVFLEVCETIGDVIRGIPEALQKFVDEIISGYETVRAAVKDRTGFDISQPFIDAYNAVVDFVNTVKTKITDGSLWQTVQTALEPIGNFFTNLFAKDENGDNDITKGLSDVLSDTITKFGEFKTILETEDLPNILSRLYEGIKKPIKNLSKEFQKLLGTDKNGGLTNINDIFTNISNVFSDVKSSLEKSWKDIQPLLEDIQTKLKPIIDPIVTIIDTTIQALTKTLDNIAKEGLTAEELAHFGLIGVLIYLSKKLEEIANAFNNVGNSFKQGMQILVQPVTNFVNAIVNNVIDNSKKLRADAFKSYAIGILAIVGALVALTYINLNGISTSIAIVAGAVAMVGAIVNSVSKMTTELDSATIAVFSLFVNQLGSAILKIAIGMAIADAASDDIKTTGTVFIGMITSIYLIYKSLADLASTHNKDFIGDSAILSFAKLVKAIGIYILLISVAVKILVDAYVKNYTAFGLAFSVIEILFSEMTGLIAIFNSADAKAINSMAESGALTILGIALIEIAVAIDILALGIMGLTLVAQQNKDAFVLARSVVYAMIIAVGIFYKAFEDSPFTVDSAASMFIIADALVLMSIAMDILLAGFAAFALAAKNFDANSVLYTIAVVGLCSILLSLMVGAVGIFAEAGPEIALGFITGGLAMIAMAAGIDLMLAGIIALITAVKDIPPADINKIWGPVGAALLLMAVFSVLNVIFMAGGIMGAAGLIAAAGSIWILAQAMNALVPAIEKLGVMDRKQLFKGLGAIVVMAVLMIIMMGTLAILSPFLITLAVAAVGFGAAVFLVAAAFAVFAGGLLAFAAAGDVAVPVIIGLAAAFGTGLVNGIVDGILAFVKRLPEIVHELGEVFFKLLDELQTIVINWLVYNVTSTVTGLIKVVIAFAKVAGPLIAKLCEVLIDLFTQVLKGINNGLERNKHEIAYYIGNIIAMLLEIILEALYVALAKLGEWFNTITPVVLNDIRQFGIDLGTNLFNGIKQMGEDLSTIANWLLDILFPSSGEIKDRLDKVLDAIANTLGIDLRSIVGGVVNGVGSVTGALTDAAGNVTNAAGDFFGGIVNGAKDALKINSPSKVMRDDIVGTGIIGGILSGFNLYGDDAKNAMTSLSDDMVSSFSDSILGINLEDLYSDSLNPTITPVVDLSNVDTSFKDISKMSENVKFDFTSISNAFNAKKTSEQQRAANQEALLNDIVKGFENQSASESALADAIINSNKDTKIYLDKDILIGSTYRSYDSKLGKLTTLQRRQ